MFSIQQSPIGNRPDPLAGYGFAPTPLPSLGNLSSLDRLAAPTQFSSPMPMMQIQSMNQMLVSMMSMLMSLMLNRSSGATPNAAALASPPVTNGSPTTSTPFDSSQTPRAGGPKVQKLIDAALSKQGTPYVFGAAGPDKFDCSGLVSWALKQAGSNIPRMTAEGLRKHYSQASVSKDQLQPGDLVFFWSPNTRGIPKGQATHVEIYLGDGKTMGTDSPKEGAAVEPINWGTFIGGARPPELAG